MSSETEVISCPACKHLLRVPADWLGTQVQCPECRAMFSAPVRDGDRLTEPVLLSRPADAGTAPERRGKPDAMLLIPAFALLFLGIAGVGVNGYLTVQFARHPDMPKDILKVQFEQMRKAGMGVEDPEDKRAEIDDARATDGAKWMKVAVPTFLAVSGGVFSGGLSMATRRRYRVAQLGCVLACLNVAHFCCVPGAVFGVWGLLMLSSSEGRAHFGRV